MHKNASYEVSLIMGWGIFFFLYITFIIILITINWQRQCVLRSLLFKRNSQYFSLHSSSGAEVMDLCWFTCKTRYQKAANITLAMTLQIQTARPIQYPKYRLKVHRRLILFNQPMLDHTACTSKLKVYLK